MRAIAASRSVEGPEQRPPVVTRGRSSTLSPDTQPPSIVLFGINCTFTREVARTLIDAGAAIRAVILPGSPSLARPTRTSFPLFGGPRPILGLGSQRNTLPAYIVGDLRSGAVTSVIEDLEPDFVVVACFTRLLPRAIRRASRVAALNIHPSLLPRWRGPDPVFWTLRAGDGTAGVTVHELTGRFDAGPVLEQQAVAYPDGVTEDELDAMLAKAGGRITLRAIERLARGDARRIAQDDALASWARWPEEADFEVDRSGPARAAFNFARGIAGRGHPVTVEVDGQRHAIAKAIAWTKAEREARERCPEGTAVLAFADGFLIACLSPLEA